MNLSKNGENLAQLMLDKINNPSFHQVFNKQASIKEGEFSSEEVISLLSKHSEKLENLGLTKIATKLLEVGEIFLQEHK